MSWTGVAMAKLLTINPNNQQKQREQNTSKIEKIMQIIIVIIILNHINPNFVQVNRSRLVSSSTPPFNQPQ